MIAITAEELDLRTHAHYWEASYITIDGVESLSCFECDCGLALFPDALEKILNHFPNILVFRYAIQKSGD